MGILKHAFGRKLRQIRKEQNLTQEALAELVGIHPRQVSKIETGEHFPATSTIENICIELSVPVKELFNFDLFEVTEETGTGSQYTYKAVVEGNVVYIDNENFKKQKIEQVNSSGEIDLKMITMAKKIRQAITVQYCNGEDNYKTIEYYPDGTYKVLKNNKQTERDLLVADIKNVIVKDETFDYFKTALGALKNNSDLERLECLLSGMKMGRQNNI